MKNFDANLYKIDLREKKEIQSIDLINFQNVNEINSIFQIQILNVINRHAPYKKLPQRILSGKLQHKVHKDIDQNK